MKFLAFRLLLTACVCRLGNCQSAEDAVISTVDAAIVKIEALTQKLQEMQSGLELMQGSQNDLHRKVEDIMTKLETQEERDSKMDILNNTCSKDQIAALHESFTTDIERVEQAIRGCSSSEQISNFKILLSTDECADGTHDCGPNAVCEDALIKYKCTCPHGYVGDSLTCEDINECTAGSNACHRNAHCTNTVGSYTCSCHFGYSGDGFACEDIDECSTGDHGCHKHAHCTNGIGNYSCTCFSGYSGNGYDCTAGPCTLPSKTVTGLGCVTPVKTRKDAMAAKQYCLDLGLRLLEGISYQAQLNELKEKFYDGNFEGYVWIGIDQWRWTESKESVRSSLWGSGQPHRGSETCGYIRLADSSTPYLGDNPCYPEEYFLCQATASINN